ncbi:MAG TPA: hypothetical protein VJ755_09450 [Gemmatimonadales bacterium]|nr:hypothetical protein [Gemmatimonadales bacterium]
MPWRAGRDETDFAMDYPDRNHCGGREDDSSTGQEADYASAGSAIHTNGVSGLSFAAHHG